MTPAKKRNAIAPKIAQPCRWSFAMRPKVKVSPAGIAKIRNIERKFVSGFGFSKGCAALALMKPPPFVPSCLIASCEATGPMAIVCLPPSRVVTSW